MIEIPQVEFFIQYHLFERDYATKKLSQKCHLARNENHYNCTSF